MPSTSLSIAAKVAASTGSAAYSSRSCCQRIGSRRSGIGGDQVATSALPRIASGITDDTASPLPPGTAATQRLSQPVLPPLPAVPFSTQSCASKCERWRYGGATATTGSNDLRAYSCDMNCSLPCKAKSASSRCAAGWPSACAKSPRKDAKPGSPLGCKACRPSMPPRSSTNRKRVSEADDPANANRGSTDSAAADAPSERNPRRSILITSAPPLERRTGQQQRDALLDRLSPAKGCRGFGIEARPQRRLTDRAWCGIARRRQSLGERLRRLHALEQGIRPAPVCGDITESGGRPWLEYGLPELSLQAHSQREVAVIAEPAGAQRGDDEILRRLE